MKTKLKSFLREEWLQLLLILAPIVAALVAIPFATDRVPMQWSQIGEVTWYAPKSWGLLVLPLSMLALYPLLFWLEGRDPSRHRETDGGLTAHGKATRAIRLLLAGIMGAAAVVQISWALGHRPDVGRWVVTAVAFTIAFVGNLFGKLKPNRYVGIRVPWTLNSAHVWRETHRVAGWVWTSSSLVVGALAWLLPREEIDGPVGVVWIALLIVVPLAVAWRESRLEKRL